MSHALRDFVAPIMEEDLIQPKRRAELSLHSGKSMANCAKLFSWEKFLEVSAKSHGRNQLRVTLRRQAIAPSFLQADNLQDTANLDKLLKHGASFIVPVAHRWDDELGKIAEEFCQRSDDNGWFGAIGSTGQDGALMRHSDAYDLFIVQVEGAKSWTIYERDENSNKIALQVTLTPGDYLYVPEGYPHECKVSGDKSLHLGFGIAASH